MSTEPKLICSKCLRVPVACICRSLGNEPPGEIVWSDRTDLLARSQAAKDAGEDLSDTPTGVDTVYVAISDGSLPHCQIWLYEDVGDAVQAMSAAATRDFTFWRDVSRAWVEQSGFEAAQRRGDDRLVWICDVVSGAPTRRVLKLEVQR